VTDGYRFPFGQPVLPRHPSASDRRPVYVLGAYPSALHVRWAPSPADSGKAIAALPVDNEPEPFWDGDDEQARIDAWKLQIGYNPERHGTVTPAGGRNNGSSGEALDRFYLTPLSVDRSATWITDALDTYRMSAGVKTAIDSKFNGFADRTGLPRPHLLTHPDEAQIVKEATEEHVDRLRTELNLCQPELIVTLGRAAFKVLGALVDEPRPTTVFATSGYGEPISLSVAGRAVSWRALAHPGIRSRAGIWQDAHDEWVARATTR
jgi:hypothetical protein